MGPYYILLLLSVLTVITDSFKILESRDLLALGNWEQGKEKYSLACKEKLMVHSTHNPTENATFSKDQIPDNRAFLQADTEEKRSYGVWEQGCKTS